MSEEQKKQIDSCMNLITKERFFDLKLAFEGAIFVFENRTKSAVKKNNSESKISIFQKNLKESNITR
jgi:hypothetical protein